MKLVICVILSCIIVATAVFAVQAPEQSFSEISKYGSTSVIVLHEGRTSIPKPSGVNNVYEYIYTPGFAARVDTKGLRALENDPHITAIIPYEELTIQLAESVPLIEAPKAWDGSAIGTQLTGKDQTVCVVDTGVDYTHPALGQGLGEGNKVLGGYDFINNNADPMDDNSHGTHVSGTVASIDSTYKGVAPDAHIVAAKVCNSFGSCPNSAMIAGVEWCVEHADEFGVSVITMSIGDGGEWNDTTCPTWLDAALKAAYDKGIITTISSGNSYNNNGIGYPACSPYAISVGSTTKQDTFSGFGNLGPNLDITAPGSDIKAPVPGGNYEFMSGTSMATPHVAGVALLVKQQDGFVSPEEFRESIVSSGKTITDPVRGSYPRINVTGTLQSLKGPIIGSIKCQVDDSWDDCTNIAYGSTLTAIMAGCVAQNGGYQNISDVNFEFSYEKEPLFSKKADEYSQGYWILETDQDIKQSGEYALTVICKDKENEVSEKSIDIFVPYGQLEINLVSIETLESFEVSQFEEFTLTAEVTCVGGDCPDVTALVGLNKNKSTTHIEEDFESGEWDGTGLWHKTNQNNQYGDAHSPEHSMWYGQEDTGDYDTGEHTFGTLYSPFFSVDTGENVTVSFWSTHNTEDIPWDTKKVYIETQGYEPVLLSTIAGLQEGWTYYSFDIDEAISESATMARLAFEFDSVDGTLNDFKGWFVDDVLVTGKTSFRPFSNYENTPFYTKDTNPGCGNLYPGVGCVVSWRVVATGEIDTIHDVGVAAYTHKKEYISDTVEVTILPFKDDDEDGIPDVSDTLIGFPDDITYEDTLHMTVGGSTNLSKVFEGEQEVVIGNGTHTLLSFYWDFNYSTLNIMDVEIEVTPTGIAVRGLTMQPGKYKTAFIPGETSQVCILDTPSANLVSISPTCTNQGETLVPCEGSVEQYSCSNTEGYVIITGLEHSAVQFITQLPSISACNDGIDNDKDGRIDYPDDPGCESMSDDNEKDPTLVARRAVHLPRIAMHDIAQRGDFYEVYVEVDNTAYKTLDDVKITVFIEGVDARKRVGPFNVKKGDSETKRVLLEIPYDVVPGLYDVRIVISNDETRRVRVRQVMIE